MFICRQGDKNLAEITRNPDNISNFAAGEHNSYCLFCLVALPHKGATAFANSRLYRELKAIELTLDINHLKTGGGRITMKKLLVSMIFVVAVSMSAFAQNAIVNNLNNKAYFGIRVGGELTCPGMISANNVGVNCFKNGGGVEFGGIYNIPVVANFYIEPGLKLYYDTYSLKKEFVAALQDDIIFNSLSIRKFGMRIPVMAGYHFDFANDVKVSLFTGPELEVGFTAEGVIKGYNVDMSESLYGDYDIMNRVNVIWGIGAGVSYQHFQFSVNGGLGMLNMLSNDYATFHENRVTFSVGYNF